MNFMSIIGIIESFEINKEGKSTINVKIDSPFYREGNNYQQNQIVPVKFNSFIFKNILKILTINSVVGIKGRIEIENNNIELVAERIKLF